ncbi:MAG: hypothetical protein LUD82_08885 [Clostridiales bacterium]|nr:hypothetical protein [Clostridiales bacterium]
MAMKKAWGRLVRILGIALVLSSLIVSAVAASSTKYAYITPNKSSVYTVNVSGSTAVLTLTNSSSSASSVKYWCECSTGSGWSKINGTATAIPGEKSTMMKTVSTAQLLRAGASVTLLGSATATLSITAS